MSENRHCLFDDISSPPMGLRNDGDTESALGSAFSSANCHGLFQSQFPTDADDWEIFFGAFANNVKGISQTSREQLGNSDAGIELQRLQLGAARSKRPLQCNGDNRRNANVNVICRPSRVQPHSRSESQDPPREVAGEGKCKSAVSRCIIGMQSRHQPTMQHGEPQKVVELNNVLRTASILDPIHPDEIAAGCPNGEALEGIVKEIEDMRRSMTAAAQFGLLSTAEKATLDAAAGILLEPQQSDNLAAIHQAGDGARDFWPGHNEVPAAQTVVAHAARPSSLQVKGACGQPECDGEMPWEVSSPVPEQCARANNYLPLSENLSPEILPGSMPKSLPAVPSEPRLPPAAVSLAVAPPAVAPPAVAPAVAPPAIAPPTIAPPAIVPPAIAPPAIAPPVVAPHSIGTAQGSPSDAVTVQINPPPKARKRATRRVQFSEPASAVLPRKRSASKDNASGTEEDEAEMRKRIRREKNRESVEKCRKKQRERLAKLEQERLTLIRENAIIEKLLQDLRERGFYRRGGK